ncbi:hypothetical protein QUA54_25415 [Microcoleus sp. MOSTC5]|uniref:hypothetical protein n=1 Tax=Microcoleus sp. MOSTC5 TaxID=3055378 RepID=UPI002FD4C4D8
MLRRVNFAMCDRNLRPRRHFPQFLNGGLRNGRAFADGMSELNGEKVGRQRRWEYLRPINQQAITILVV